MFCLFSMYFTGSRWTFNRGVCISFDFTRRVTRQLPLQFPPPLLVRIFLTPFSGRKDFPKLQWRPIFMYRKFATPSTPNVPRHRGSFPIPNYPETRYKSALRNAVAFLRNYPAKWSHCFACLTCLN